MLIRVLSPACDASAEVAQDTVQALLDGSVMCSEMRSKLVSGLVIAMQNSEVRFTLRLTAEPVAEICLARSAHLSHSLLRPSMLIAPLHTIRDPYLHTSSSTVSTPPPR